MKTIDIKQLQKGIIIYHDKIESYNYSIPQLIKNGATEIRIKYPTSTIVVKPIKAGGLQ